MSADESIQAATERVLKFARDWTVWETEMASKEGSLRDPAMKERHAALIAEHCTIKKRAYVDGLLSYSQPPVYADIVAGNRIGAEAVTAKKVHLDLGGSRMQYRFVVIFSKGEWRIDSLKWRVHESQPWTNGLIGS